MSAISGCNYFNSSASSTGTSGKAAPPKSHHLYTWKTTAVSAGLLAATGGLLAAYCLGLSDENNAERNSSQTDLATRTTSLTQDMALIVSTGIMPFFGLLGASIHVFKGEQNQIKECFQDSKREILIENLMTFSADYEGQEIPDVSKLIDLARESYAARCLEEAESLIQLISQEEDRNDLCEELAEESTLAGRFDEAEKFIKLMSKGEARWYICDDLAKKNYEAGHVDKAERFIQLMLEDPKGHDWTLEDLAKKSHHAKRFDEVERFVHLMIQDQRRDQVLKDLAKKSYRAGSLDQTEKWIQLMTNRISRDFLSENLAAESDRNGCPDKARRLIQLVDSEKQEIPDVSKLIDLARDSYDARCLEEAESLIQLISQEKDRNDLCEELAEESALAERFDEAEKFIKLMSKGQARSYICDDLAKKNYEAGHVDKAERFILLMVEDPKGHDWTLEDLAKKSHHAKRFDEAERFVHLMIQDQSRDPVLKDLAKKSYRAGSLDQTEKWIQLMTNQVSRDFLSENLAEESYRNGRPDEAGRLIQLMEKVFWRSSICEKLAKASYHAGRFDEALQFIHLINDESMMGTVSLKHATQCCIDHRLNEAEKSIRLLPNSYNGFTYPDINLFKQECFKACALEFIDVNSDKSLDELAYQKYLELIRFIPNASLQELLYQPWKDVKAPDLIPDCMDSENCPVIDPERVPSRAIEAVTSKGRRETLWEWLRLRKDDPRDKALFLVGAADHNGALHPFYHERMLRVLDSKYDLKYQIISKEETLREAVESAKKTGKLVRIYIDAHGTPTSMRLGQKPDEIIDRSSNFSSYFSGLPSHLVIVLPGCLTGAPTSDGTDNLAQTIADTTQKTVIAAREKIRTYFDIFDGKLEPSRPGWTFSDSEELFHPSESDDSKNSFVTFRPRK